MRLHVNTFTSPSEKYLTDTMKCPLWLMCDCAALQSHAAAVSTRSLTTVTVIRPHSENNSMSYLEIFILFCIFVLNVTYGLVHDFTKLAPQHRETPVSSLKHLSVFCSWRKKRKQRNNWAVQWAGNGARSWHWRILHRSISLSLNSYTEKTPNTLTHIQEQHHLHPDTLTWYVLTTL